MDAKSNVEKSKAEVKSHRDEVKEIDIEYEIRRSYAMLQYLESKKNILVERLRILDALEELAKSAVRSGKGKLSNVLFIERKQESINADLGLLAKKVEQPTITINRWVGRELNTKIDIVEDLDISPNKDEMLQYARTEHPQYAILDDRMRLLMPEWS